MEIKQIFIQLNEETKFNTVKILRPLNKEEDQIDRQRNGLIAAIKMNFGTPSSEFLAELNDFYKTTDIPLLHNLTVLALYGKWKVNKSIFYALRLLLDELSGNKIKIKNELWDKVIQNKEILFESNHEILKFNSWLIGKVILIVFTSDNIEKIDGFINTIWRSPPLLHRTFVQDKFLPTAVDKKFKPIWIAFSIFKKRKAKLEIYLTFFNDFFVKLIEPVVAEKKFHQFLPAFFQKNNIEIVYAFNYKDYLRFYEIYHLNIQCFDKLPDLSKLEISYNKLDRITPESTCFKQLYTLLTDYGISYFFFINFFHSKLNSQEKEWFDDVVQGKNLVYSKNLPFNLTKKVAHFFNTTPENWKNNSKEMTFDAPANRYGIIDNNYTLTQSLIYCVIFFDINDENYTKEVLRNIRTIDNLDFWIITLCILYHKGLQVDDINQVIDYIDYHVFRNARKINFKTKKLSNLLEEVNDWHEELYLLRTGKYKRIINLPKSEIKSFSIVLKDNKYQVIQLITNKALIDEGSELSHCVGTYSLNCLERGSYIFSLRLEQEAEESIPLITIEINQNSIRQKLGKWNRPCSVEEDKIIRIWAKENKLVFI